MITQFVPEEFCLKCQGCCRFRKEDSAWSPCLLDEEVQDLLDRKIPPAAISSCRRLVAIPNPQGEGFICPFLGLEDNKCQIYSFRPFECQFYPFLLNVRGKKVLLTVDINCPYVSERLNTPEFHKYTDYLSDYLND